MSHEDALLITLGTLTREEAATRFPFLAARYSGRRQALKEFTHRDPEFVFWIYPDGRLFDAKDAHRKNVPRGFAHILDDEPHYGGFLRGRVARNLDGFQLIVVYCPEEALVGPGPKLDQLLLGLQQMPIPIDPDALVVSDNADLYGSLAELRARA